MPVTNFDFLDGSGKYSLRPGARGVLFNMSNATNNKGIETMTELPTVSEYQVKAAADFGRATFLAGDNCVPAFDARLMAMLTGRNIGQTPEGEASSLDIMTAWSTAWHKANLAAPVPRLHVT